MKVRGISEGGVAEAAAILRRGGVIISPTDTVYGLLCDATSEEAVARVYKIKKREPSKPLQVAVSKKDVADYAKLSAAAEKIVSNFWPGCVSIVVEKKDSIPDFVTRETVCLSCQENEVAGRLLELAGRPLVSTSANFSGAKPPKRFSEINPRLLNLVDLALDGGETGHGKPNTIVDATREPARILREGPVSRAELARVVEAGQ